MRAVIAMNPKLTQLFNEAVALHRAGRLGEAEQRYKAVLVVDPAHVDAIGLLGTLYAQSENYVEAARLIGVSLQINPRQPAALNNRGILLSLLKRHDEALASFEGAIALRPDFAEAHYNRGNALQEGGRYADALASFDRAIAFQPNYTDAWINRGQALQLLKRFDDAIVSYERALAIRPDADALTNRGNALQELRRYEDALASYDRALALDPQNAYANGARLHTQMMLADWRDFDGRCRVITDMVQAGAKASVPFPLLAISTTPQLLKRCAQIYAEDKHPKSSNPLWQGERYAHERIRVGYVSADFHNHPVAYLTAELFERHDRARFEVVAFSVGANARDSMRERLEQGFDRFHEVAAQSDEAIAKLIRELEIDILVDLQGFTRGNRTGVFSRRSAPIQVNYLGYAGTMGASYMDYILADEIVIPPKDFAAYTEKVIHLPHSYMPSDSKRIVSPTTPSRVEVGLPEQGFVFCCFNNSYKITPDLFSVWMRILGKTEGSVLWLREDNPATRANLLREAQQRGVAADRLIFAGRVPDMADHLARYRLADLFLDTFYFNAHTTASDALWAGLPLLTCLRNSFAGRVAASLLTAVGMPELITASADEYERKALKLASNPALLSSLKQKLAANRTTQPLFDTAPFTRRLESAYTMMWQRQQRGETPDQMAITP